MSKKINVLLDLDQTIISAEDDGKYDAKKHADRAKKFTFHELKEGKQLYYTIFERPGLQPFLDYLFANYNVSVWTAASKFYALFIIENIVLANKPNRKLDWIFFSYHCDISKKIKKGTKDLSIMWDIYRESAYKADNTVIIDDYNEIHKTQPGNCIIAVPFEFTHEGSEDDTYLDRLQTVMKDMQPAPKLAKKVNKTMGTV